MGHTHAVHYSELVSFILFIMECPLSEVLLYRLIPHLHVFIKGCSGHLGHYIGLLLREVLSGGPSVTLKVKEEDIFKMMCVLFTSEKETASTTKYTLFSALMEFLEVS